MNDRIRIYRLLRKLNMVWFDRFLRDCQVENERHRVEVNRLIELYDDPSYMEPEDE